MVTDVQRVFEEHGSLVSQRIYDSVADAVEHANAVSAPASLSMACSTVFSLLPGPGLASTKVSTPIRIEKPIYIRGCRKSDDDESGFAEYASRIAGSCRRWCVLFLFWKATVLVDPYANIKHSQARYQSRCWIQIAGATLTSWNLPVWQRRPKRRSPS